MKNLITIFCLFILSTVKSQLLMERSVFASAGSSSNIFSYTLGEPIVGFSLFDSLGCNIGFQQNNIKLNNSSVIDNIYENEITIFPNPALVNQDIQIHHEFEDMLIIKIFNSTGKLLSSDIFSGNQISITAPSLSGVYSILINNYCYRLVVLN